jgi:hypothetical protein
MSCPTIIIDDFNIDMLDQNSAQWDELKKFTWHIIQWNFQFLKIMTIYDTHKLMTFWQMQQLNNVRTSRVVETYWTHHKPIYFAFKLPYSIPKDHRVKLSWNILKSSQANIFCIQTPIFYSKRSSHKVELKHIEIITSQYILHSNSHTIFQKITAWVE